MRMAGGSKIGTEWQDDELDAIAAEYFDMLAVRQCRPSYLKLKHSKAAKARIVPRFGCPTLGFFGSRRCHFAQLIAL